MNMKNFVKKALVLVFAGLCMPGLKVLGQEQQFSFTQYMDNLTPLNTAYSMLQTDGGIHTTVRKQWAGIPGAPTTFLMNGNLPLTSINGSVGLVAMNDSYTIEHLNSVSMFFAKAIRLSEHTNLAVSLSGGFKNYVVNYSSLGATDPQFGNDVRQNSPNVGLGLMLYTESYFLALSLPELSINNLGVTPYTNNSNFRNNYYLSAGYTTGSDADIRMKYAGLLSYSNGLPLMADISGTVLVQNQFGIGADLRSNNELAGIITVNLDKIHLGYSYQFGLTSSNIGGMSNATHEVTLGISFGRLKQTGR